MPRIMAPSSRRLNYFFIPVMVVVVVVLFLYQMSFTLYHRDVNNKLPKDVHINEKVYFKTTAKKCLLKDLDDKYYKSQSGEDKKLMKWFGTICEGSYIEMGALDGVKYSNSYVFNKGLKWRGVMIELMKNNFDKLVRNRQSEIATINAGVCDVPRTLHYTDNAIGPAVGGIYEFSTQSFRERWWKNISLDSPSVHEIECNTLDSLLLRHAPENVFFDFFSLDVEGAEFAVLQSVDWKRIGFGIIFVEAGHYNEMKNLAMRGLVESQGYTFLEDFHRSYWFVNKDFHEIYKDLVH
jgi:FkbM family methyltransferase